MVPALGPGWSGTCYENQAGLKLAMIFLPLLPKRCDYGHAPPHLRTWVQFTLGWERISFSEPLGQPCPFFPMTLWVCFWFCWSVLILTGFTSLFSCFWMNISYILNSYH